MISLDTMISFLFFIVTSSRVGFGDPNQKLFRLLVVGSAVQTERLPSCELGYRFGYDVRNSFWLGSPKRTPGAKLRRITSIKSHKPCSSSRNVCSVLLFVVWVWKQFETAWKPVDNKTFVRNDPPPSE